MKMYYNLTGLLLFVLMVPLSGKAAVVGAVRTHAVPKIDGKLDDACWKTAKPITTFLIKDSESPSQSHTAASVLYDDSAIYVGVRCEEPDISMIKTAKVCRDGNLWGYDCVEVMLDPTCSKDEYFHFAVNPSGSVFDRTVTQGGYIGNEQWNGEWQAASFIGDCFWSCEIAIPFYNLGISSKVKSSWGINICREKKLPMEENSSIAEKGAFNIAGRFAELQGLNIDFSQYAYVIGVPTLDMKVKEKTLNVQVNIPVQNDTGKECPTRVECWLISPSGKTQLDSCLISLSAGKKQVHSAQFSLTEQGEYSCYLAISSSDTRKMLAFSNSMVTIRYTPMAVKVIEPWYRDAIFETQNIKQVVFDVEINLEDVEINLEREELKDKILEVGIREKGQTEPLVSKCITTVDEKNRLVFDAAKLPYGRLEIYARLRDNTGIPVVNGDISYPLRKLPYKKGEVWLDKEKRYCIEGKPFFCNGAWEDPEYFLPEYTVSLYGKRENMPNDIKLISGGVQWAEMVRKIEPRLQQKQVDEDTLAVYREEVRRIKDDPNLFAYYYMDEPSAHDYTPAALKQVYQAIRDEDPYHPVIISQGDLGNAKAYSCCADIDFLHPYPPIFRDKEHNDLSTVVTTLEGFIEFHRDSPTKQTFFYMHPGFNWTDYGRTGRRIATYRELRDQNLLALIMGARGFMQYNRMKYHYPENYIGMPHLTKELAYYGQVVLAPKLPDMPKASSETMKMLLKKVDGNLYLFACNADMTPRKVTISIPGVNKRSNHLSVISEDRTVTLEKDTFTDDFDTYEVHVYTTSDEKTDLLTVKEICRQIDEANGKRKKPGNLAFQMFEEGDVVVRASSFSGAGAVTLWHVVDGIIEEIPDPYNALVWKDKTPDKFPDWLEIQLPEKQTISRVVVYAFQKSLRDYTVQAFVDGEWKDIAGVVGKNEDKLTHVFNPVITDRIRLWITGTNGPYACVSEVEIYAE